MQQVRFSKNGYEVNLTITGINRLGSLEVQGTISGRSFRGTYGGDAIVFAQAVKIGATKIGGVRPVDAAKAELDRILAEMRAEQAAAAERYRTARFERVHLVVGMDTDHVYVYPVGLERPAAEPEQPNQPTPVAEVEKDDRPVLRVKRCWECGRLDVVQPPTGMSRAEAERILYEVTRRAIEAAGEGTLAAVPKPTDAGLPVRIRVAYCWYCGC